MTLAYHSKGLRSARGLAAVLFLMGAMTAPASGRAPNPARSVSTDVYAGRWYEIARTPNSMQKDCEGPTSDFTGWSDGSFLVTETCHRGGPGGPAKVVRAKAKIISGAGNARFRMSFFGGLVHQEYWVLDHAEDNSWLILATPGGNYVWLMGRRPSLPPLALAAATARAESLGYARSRLVFPVQASG